MQNGQLVNEMPDDFDAIRFLADLREFIGEDVEAHEPYICGHAFCDEPRCIAFRAIERRVS